MGQKMNLINRFFKVPNTSCFIFGPRGTGKSTWVKQTVHNDYLIDLLDEINLLRYNAHPEYLKEYIIANPSIENIVIDEVQRLPKLLDVIHQLIEEKVPQHFIMTGSSARKLKHAGVNLLAGRAILTHFHPLMAAELGKRFDLNYALRYGMLPLVLDSEYPDRTLETYIALYIKEEVHAEGLVRNFGGFSRFLEFISFSHGSTLNLNNIARECQATRKSVENYLSILEDLLLAYQLPIFNKRAKRELISHTKFYLFDSGVYHALRPKGPLDQPSEITGIALEGLVMQHLRAWCDYSGQHSSCYYWRTRGGAEVDFVIYGEHHFYAIEVKNSTSVHATDLKSLKTFMTDYPEAKPLMLYRGKDKLIIDQIPCYPIEDFLLTLKPYQPLMSGD